LKNQPFRPAIWFKAARLRTLPLALAVSGLGNFLAIYSSGFQWIIVFFSIGTTIFLQVLSNFSNDLGDSIHGADHKDRKGPMRTVQSGELSKKQMLSAVYLMAGLSLVTGCFLLWVSFQNQWEKTLPFFFIGIASIAAAYLYTNGKKPYGYQALGDASVFIFFGLVAVLGTAYLHNHNIDFNNILPAIWLGCWSTAVLNINNMRDIESDQQAGKQTIPIVLGLKSSKIYHLVLVGIGFISILIFAILKQDLCFLGAIPGTALVFKTTFSINKTEDIEAMDQYLKPQAIGTFLAVLGIIIFSVFLHLMF